MIRVDKQDIIDGLTLKPFGASGWWANNKEEVCPWCKKGDKWGIVFNEELHTATYHCQRCGKKTNIYTYLKEVGRLDLVKGRYESSNKETKLLKIFDETKKKEIEKEHVEVQLPKKLKRLENDPYLDGRSFLSCHYEQFEPSVTDYFLEKRFHDYTIFKLKMNGVVVAFLARSMKSKEWHKENLKLFKQRKATLCLRYINSGADFVSIVGGYDELIEGQTKTVIIVEGIFDKVNVDKLLNLHKIPDIKCIFTFGNSISAKQIKLLEEKKIEDVILMYDPDANQIKKGVGMILNKHFNTRIAFLDRDGIDPGDMELEYLQDVLSKLKNPMEYYLSVM